MDIDSLFSVDGKTALVTGGSRGIGMMIAEGLVRAGANVYISSRKADVCEAEAVRLSQYGTCISVPADLSTYDGVHRLASEIAGLEDQLHILINNAGAAWGAPLEDYPDHAWDKVLAVNVKAVFELTATLLPQLEAAGTFEDPARVVNIGSVDGIRVSETDNYAYAASKAAVHMVTRQTAHRLTHRKITVNAIAPGPFRSKMMSYVLDSEGGEHAVASTVPLGRIGSPEDIVGAVLYLTSRAGSYLTGAVIPVDGGYSTHG